MAYPAGQYILDGGDLWMVYGIIVTDSAGSNDLMKFPERKDSISHDWEDENGLDIDLSRVYLKAREATFNMAILARTEVQFWEHYNAFLAMITRPDLRRLEIAELSSSFYVYYKACSSFERFTRVKQGTFKGYIASKFSLTLVEKEPTLDASNQYWVDDENRFIIS
ncbi:hypothetical protein AB6805_30650 [Chitinophaga sp. RCC_12]|uniref:hypothetical protein n=1 Tax=Chitinophaga sp. RCC_12 TaxID=3239226 RepID=UPI0035234508